MLACHRSAVVLQCFLAASASSLILAVSRVTLNMSPCRQLPAVCNISTNGIPVLGRDAASDKSHAAQPGQSSAALHSVPAHVLAQCQRHVAIVQGAMHGV